MTTAAQRQRIADVCGIAGAILVAAAGLLLAPLLLEHERPQPPAFAITTSTAKPPPPQPPTQTTAQTQPAPASAAIPDLALPTLELPAISSALALPRLTATGIGDWQVDLPTLPQHLAPELPPGASHGPRRLVTPDLSAVYPWRARRQGTEGRSTVALTIDETGAVTEVRLIGSFPAGVFDRAAEQAARQLRYEPAVEDGQPITSWVQETFIWSIK